MFKPNNVDPCEMAHNELPQVDLRCFQIQLL